MRVPLGRALGGCPMEAGICCERIAGGGGVGLVPSHDYI